MVTIQVTLFDPNNRYKPVSSLITVESIEGFKTNKTQIAQEGIIKICQKRYWTKKDLKKYGYKECRIRVYKEE